MSRFLKPFTHMVRPAARMLYQLGAKAYDQAQADADFDWFRSPMYRRLDGLLHEHAERDSLRGKRCFILGNGPSLNRTALDRLEGEITLATNKIFLLFDRISWRPTFFLCVNELVIEQSVDQIRAMPSVRLLAAGSASLFGDEPIGFVRRLSPQRMPDRFSRDIRLGWVEGHTVTFCALQLAWFLGCDPVILIGVDHNYQRRQGGQVDAREAARGEDVDHFSASYFAAGQKWDLPNLPMSEMHYRQARHAFEADGRRVLDATVDGKLTVFEKGEFGELF